MGHLEKLRAQIDCIDEQIIELLAKRFKIVEKIGKFKKLQNMSPLQKGRWQEVLESRKDLAQQKGLDPDFVEKIWQLIHEYSLNIQEKI